MTGQQFDRRRDDVGNVFALEHVNLRVPDQGLAALFYVTVLGGTRDPFMDFGLDNMWVNFGRQQFHLPTGDPQRLPGEIGLIVPDLARLQQRLDRLAPRFDGTAYAWEPVSAGAGARTELVVHCPWGNRLRCRTAQDDEAPSGIPYIDVRVARGATDGIGRFYERVLRAPAHVEDGVATIAIGRDQTLRFRETDDSLLPYDGHHIAIYIAHFSAPHGWLAERGLISEESGPHQYRFQRIVDPDDGRLLAELEHEVRSLHHPMFGRPLVNRNPNQRIRDYRAGHDALAGL
jgi:hypothetical protein